MPLGTFCTPIERTLDVDVTEDEFYIGGNASLQIIQHFGLCRVTSATFTVMAAAAASAVAAAAAAFVDDSGVFWWKRVPGPPISSNGTTKLQQLATHTSDLFSSALVE
uniref:Uncharacterized protein n=1 Tax=Ascaris lumbricoides TaxID=6252 RepID=A0A0M3IJH9_ASCLU